MLAKEKNEAVSIKMNPTTKKIVWEVGNIAYGPEKGYVWQIVDLLLKSGIELLSQDPEELKQVIEFFEDGTNKNLSSLREIHRILSDEKERIRLVIPKDI